MRLEEYEVAAIKKAIESLDCNARIHLFGSRADDEKKGGDIDLLIFSGKISGTDVFEIKESICEEIGEQKIDIVVAQDESDPFVRIVLRNSVEL